MKAARLFTQNRAVDMLHGPIFKSLLLFALPVLISSIFQQFYNLADTMIVAHFLGDAALASIGATTAIYDMMVGFAIGIGSGLSVVTGRSFGSGDRDLLKRSVTHALYIGAGVSVVITVLAQVFLLKLLQFLNTPADILDMAYSYISTITLFTTVTFTYNLLSGLLRAIGNSFMPLVFLILSSIVNVFLDILFITRFSLGVAGAACATVIAQGLSAVLCAIYLWKRTKLLVPAKRHFRFDLRLFREMLGQGLAMGLMQSIVATGTVVLQYGINGLGTLIIAGHTTARKIYMFFLMPFSAMSQAISTFASQNRGANQRDRIRKAMRCLYIYDASLAAFMAIFMQLFAEMLVKAVSGSTDPTIIGNATFYLKVVGPSYFLLAVLIQTRTALQSIGSKLIPTLSSITELVVKFLFVVALIPYFGYNAVVFCEPVIWGIMSIQVLAAMKTNKFMRNTLESQSFSQDVE